MDMRHEYSRSVVIRLRYRVDGNGSSNGWMRIDSDMPDRDSLLGVLFRAQHVVLGGNDYQHDNIDLTNLDEQLGAMEIDVEDE